MTIRVNTVMGTSFVAYTTAKNITDLMLEYPDMVSFIRLA